MGCQVAGQAQQELAAAQQAHEQQQAALQQEARERVGDAKLRLQHCVRWGTRVLDRSTSLHASHNAFRWWRWAWMGPSTLYPRSGSA